MQLTCKTLRAKMGLRAACGHDTVSFPKAVLLPQPCRPLVGGHAGNSTSPSQLGATWPVLALHASGLMGPTRCSGLGWALCLWKIGLNGPLCLLYPLPAYQCQDPPASPQPIPSLPTVPSASMTRLARSRTASLTSAGSVDGSRSQPCAHSESSEGLGQVNHTMEVSC